MKKDLPIYDIKLSDDTQGVGFISLVDEPAIGVDWIKLAKQEPIELFMSLTGDGLCFGCPPNGDGTRVNGEPDARCKGDGSGKTGGKGGSKGGGSSPKAIDRKNISEAKVGDVVTYKPGSEGAIDFPDGIKVTSVRDLTEGKEPGTTKDGKQYETKVTSLTRGGQVTTQYRIRPGHLNDEDLKYIPNTNLANPITHIIRKNGDGTKSITKGPGWDRVYGKDAKYWLVEPSGQIKQNYGKPVTNTDPYGLKFSKSVKAKRVTGTLDGSGCFGCPPNGDGTRVNGEPDARCKGDGSGKTGGSKGGSKGTTKAPSEKALLKNISDKVTNAKEGTLGGRPWAGTSEIEFTTEEASLISKKWNENIPSERKDLPDGRTRITSQPFAREGGTVEKEYEWTNIIENFSYTSRDGIPTRQNPYYGGDRVGSVKKYDDGRVRYFFNNKASKDSFFKKLNL